jgi:LacI family transcriptional regulator
MVATTADVARLAGTSTAVVSYVINNGPRKVAPATRERVLRAIQELDYRPNGPARSLRSKRSRTLGLVLPDRPNSYLVELTRSIEDAAFDRGYVLVVGHRPEDAGRERDQLRMLLDHRVDALLMMGTPTAVQRELLAGSTIPVRHTDARDPDIDNRGAMRAATGHLLGHGHRQVAYIGGPEELVFAQLRREGWAAALDAAGIPRRGRVWVQALDTRQGGYEAARRLLAGPLRPSAVAAFNDEQAIGVLRAAAEADLTVPGDLAVFGFDATHDGEFTIPPLSTVRVPLADLATRIVSRALDPHAETATEPLPFELVLRRSCGC